MRDGCRIIPQTVPPSCARDSDISPSLAGAARVLSFEGSVFTLYDQLEMGSGRIASGPPGVAAFRDLPEKHEVRMP